MSTIRVGNTVRYHGSLTDLHGSYTVEDFCECQHCWDYEDRCYAARAMPTDVCLVLISLAQGVEIKHMRLSSVTLVEDALQTPASDASTPAETADLAGGSLFPELDTPAPVAAETDPLFEVPESAPAARTVDYGRVAPVREAQTTALLDVELSLPDENAAELALGFAITEDGGR